MKPSLLIRREGEAPLLLIHTFTPSHVHALLTLFTPSLIHPSRFFPTQLTQPLRFRSRSKSMTTPAFCVRAISTALSGVMRLAVRAMDRVSAMSSSALADIGPRRANISPSPNAANGLRKVLNLCFIVSLHSWLKIWKQFTGFRLQSAAGRVCGPSRSTHPTGPSG